MKREGEEREEEGGRGVGKDLIERRAEGEGRRKGGKAVGNEVKFFQSSQR